MAEQAVEVASLDRAAADAVKRTWGFDSLRPMQLDAIRAGISRRDSLVVLPTGGGKSLCYQVPPLVTGRTDVVVSPLISLMKDQVDGLRECGYPAAAIHSGMQAEDQRTVEDFVASGACRLVLVSPERVMTPRFIRVIQQARVSCFAIDEAHCISHWGHDFRPEYRRLGALKERFAESSIHAYTATATGRVQQDIVRQLGLSDPLLLVGRSDRPNLTYRIVPRLDVKTQIRDVLRRHRGEAAIVYCISRRETEEMAAYLRSVKIRVAAYHAGMESDVRRSTQDAFAQEKLDVVVATVAFGMGIDRSDVRCVIHAAMPKSIEHYQQETGRAGRDGLPAECVLLYSAADPVRWEALLTRSHEEFLANAGPDSDTAAAEQSLAAAIELLGHLRRYCARPECRHAALTQYFGQEYSESSCGACDVCLHEVEGVEEATVTAQKILSCVARVSERFGAGYVADVLCGAKLERIRTAGHDRLTTFGLLRQSSRKAVINQIHQLVDQELLTQELVSVRAGAESVPVLKLNSASWDVMRGKRAVFLSRVRTAEVAESKADAKSWDGVDRELFEELRKLRRSIAEERNVPPFVIFSDATLREMARHKPRTREGFRRLHGIGERKASDLGYVFVSCIDAFLAARNSATQSPSSSI